MAKIKVLIVDDSLLIRKMFSEILGAESNIDVVGTAEDPYDAREKIKKLNPDVVTLDIEMPKMDGLTFLKKIMTLRPMPVIMASTLTQKGAEETIRALEIGAFDYISKPTSDEGLTVDDLREELVAKVNAAARAKVSAKSANITRTATANSKLKSNKYVIAMGSSTGGVDVIRNILPLFPANTPPILITQHMPEKFTAAFANRLNDVSVVSVCEAKDGQKILPGNVYIAPGDKHLEITRGTEGFSCKVKYGEKVSGHRPSVDVLFDSVAKFVGDKAVGVMLTGMGKDGAKGMLNMKKEGAYNVGQSEDSCVVYGMPKAAFLAGAVDEQATPDNIVKKVIKYCER